MYHERANPSGGGRGEDIPAKAWLMAQHVMCREKQLVLYGWSSTLTLMQLDRSLENKEEGLPGRQ